MIGDFSKLFPAGITADSTAASYLPITHMVWATSGYLLEVGDLDFHSRFFMRDFWN